MKLPSDRKSHVKAGTFVTSPLGIRGRPTWGPDDDDWPAIRRG